MKCIMETNVYEATRIAKVQMNRPGADHLNTTKIPMIAGHIIIVTIRDGNEGCAIRALISMIE